jgi:hypothetical protein
MRVPIAVCSLLLLGSSFASSQTAPAARPAAASRTAEFKTSWGDPDLQGYWSYGTLTPLERPAAMAGREFMTKEEIAARLATVGVDRPPRAGDPGTYNAFWTDPGTVLRSGRTSRIMDPRDGRLPLKPEARKAWQDLQARRSQPPDSWLDLPLEDRCIIYHGVPPQPSTYNNSYEIIQTPGLVAIYNENIHHIRLIFTDGRGDVGRTIGQWNGISRGRWEGDTLVVETTNYNAETQLRFPSSSHTRAVERFRRKSADEIEYNFTIDDPTLYTRPWTAELNMLQTEGPLYEYACHEGNHSMIGILGGARAQERFAAEDAAKKKSEGVR